jgi:hypothetical protein
MVGWLSPTNTEERRTAINLAISHHVTELMGSGLQ